MQIGVMVTDNGPHPPEKWAEQTAYQLIQISESAPDVLLKEAKAFERKVVAILSGHHRIVQDRERDHLRTKGDERHADSLDPSEHIPDAIDAIIAAAKGTNFEAHFANPEVRAYVERLIGQHFASSMHVERLWHGDPSETAQAHRNQHGLPAPGVRASAYHGSHTAPSVPQDQDHGPDHQHGKGA